MSDFQFWLLLVTGLFILWVLISIIALDFTMMHFGFIMRFRTMRDHEGLTPESNPTLWKYAMSVLARGLLADHWVRMFVCPVVGLEYPPLCIRWWKSKKYTWLKLPYLTTEWLTTTVLIRWHHEPAAGWWTINIKKRFVRLGQVLLDDTDTDKKHIKDKE